MIRVDRDRVDSQKIQQDLKDVWVDKMPVLRKLVRDGAGKEEIQKQLTGYQLTREHLWKSQHGKCCYCEHKEQETYNDVEHYRPKSIYWWLTFTWSNLLFACKQCNRSGKNAEFPLVSMADQLQPHDDAPGNEKPLLLDPSDTTINPVEHIEFKWQRYLQQSTERWVATARKNNQHPSPFGAMSIQIYDLNRDVLFSLRDGFVKTYIEPMAKRLNRQLDEKNHTEAKYTFAEASALLNPAAHYTALTYDAFRHFVPNTRLTAIACQWPEPKDVGIARAQRPSRRVRTS